MPEIDHFFPKTKILICFGHCDYIYILQSRKNLFCHAQGILVHESSLERYGCWHNAFLPQVCYQAEKIAAKHLPENATVQDLCGHQTCKLMITSQRFKESNWAAAKFAKRLRQHLKMNFKKRELLLAENFL